MYQSHGRRRRRSLVASLTPVEHLRDEARRQRNRYLCTHISRVVEAPHAIDATIPSMLNSYNLLLCIGQLVEEPLLVLGLGLVVRVVRIVLLVRDRLLLVVLLLITAAALP